MNAKSTIVEVAARLGFQRTVIAGLQPLEPERQFYLDWLAKDYAGAMEYLKANPHFRTSPQLLYPNSLSAIVVSVSYYTDQPEKTHSYQGRVARYAVGLDYHAVLRAKLRQLKSLLEKEFGRPLLGKAFTDDVALYEQALASRHGLGFTGKNSLVIAPKLMGSYSFIAELFTDLELEPDERYSGTCGQCFRCGIACPTQAIVGAALVDARACISYLTIENRGAIPLELRKQLGDWVFGCDVCQEVCPYNQRPPETPWTEFQPHAGVGHFLDLFSLLEIADEEQFSKRFRHTPLRRPKRRGLLRNALVVLGNQLPDGGVERLSRFAAAESEPMLREHAAWALSQYKDKAARAALAQIIQLETDLVSREQMISHLALAW